MDAWRRSLICMSILTASAASSLQAQQPPVTEASAATALANEMHALIADLASQRDALGGWPSKAQDAYATLVQLDTQLDNALAAGDAATFRKRYRAAMRIAARISRWLVTHYDPANDEVPSRDKVDTIVTRLRNRLALVTRVANQAGVTLDLTAATTASAQVNAVRNTGTNAQLRAAVQALRDAIDALQDALSDQTG